MRKGFVLLFLTLLTPRLVWSQYYITLNKNNTFHYKNSYLIDIPLKDNVNNLFIQDPQRLIPLSVYPDLFETYYPDTMFVSNNLQIGKKGLQQNTLKKEIICFFKDQNSKIINTTTNIDHRFLSYKPLIQIKPKLQKDSLLIYYIESNGNDGMDIDSVYVNHPLNSFITDFEKNHHVNIGKRFDLVIGDQGRMETYFTLSELTSKQKILFLDERNDILNPRDSKERVSIYIPELFPLILLDPTKKTKAELQKEQDEIIYNAVEVEPKPTQGMDAFKALFKKIDFGGSAVLYVTFIVKKDGALSEYNVLRGGNEQTNKEVFEILKNSSTWEPGMQNNKRVNVQYTIVLRNNDNHSK